MKNYPGVEVKGNKFRATVYFKGKQERLGYFKTPEEAFESILLYKKTSLENIRYPQLTDLKDEVFRAIENLESKYAVSNFGRVRSYNSALDILSPVIDNKGYYRVKLKGRIRFIHLLVAEAFLNHKSDGTHKIVVDHIDNDKSNNHVTNLQLVSNRFNSCKDLKNKTSAYPGVSQSGNRWVAKLVENKKSTVLGRFNTEKEAALTYQNRLRELGHNVPEIFVNLNNHPYL